MHFNFGAAISSSQRCIGTRVTGACIDDSVTFEGLPHDQARYSMAYFCGANNDTVLRPLISNVTSEKLIGWDGKAIGSITAGEYYSRMFDDLYADLNPGRSVAASLRSNRKLHVIMK